LIELIGNTMKIGITHRLFLSILAATCVALLCMFLIMQWSINRGFLQYLNSLDQGRLEQMVGILEQAYAEHGNWVFLRDKPGFVMERLLHAAPADIESGKFHEFDKMGMPPPPPPAEGAHRPRFPLIVLDAERKPIFGNNAESEDVNFKPIINNNKTVGYVGLLSPKEFLNPPQVQFLSQQKFALILAALGMVLIVVIFSLPLANRLVRPIRAMAAATRDLASGKYMIRVPVSSSDELGQLARDFNAMALTLEKNEKARRQWVADISHELRTPLSVLRGEIEALLDGIRDTTPDAVRSLHAEALRLQRLVDDLYQLALSDLGTLTYHKEDLSLAGILRNSIEPYHAEFAGKRIKISADIPQETDITVFADRERLQQLFTNLLDNSLKYTDAGGELAISLSCSNSQAVLEFQDSAPGVQEDELDRLFDRLYRVEASRSRSSGGAGLGLAICRNIVEGHAGTITAHPSRLGGVLIRVSLPAAGGCS
jgi:two-component system, OmpR family, sensor histidine kinase BaeS